MLEVEKIKKPIRDKKLKEKDDIIVKKPIEKIKYEKNKKIIETTYEKINITKKINETAKIVKTENAKALEKIAELEKIFTNEVNKK